MSSPISRTPALSPTSSSNSNFPENHQLESVSGNQVNGGTISDDPSTKPKATIASRLLRHSSGSKSPEKCSICLTIPENRAYTDSCYHEFCFDCLLEWSKVKAECPLCKQKFKNIIHNIRSINDYDKYVIPTETESFGIDDAGRRFRFPTTMTVERVELLRLIRQLHLQLEESQRNNRSVQHSAYYAHQMARLRRLRRLFERSAERRERLTATSDFRQVVYERRLRAIPPAPDERGRYCYPEHYSRNPALLHRLMPWLVRELNILFKGETGRVAFLMSFLKNALTRWHIKSSEMRNHLEPYLGQRTEPFLHEFYCFALSPFNMQDYDRNVRYETWLDATARLRGPDQAPPEIVLGNSPERYEIEDAEESSASNIRGNQPPAHNPSPPPDDHRLSVFPRRARMSFPPSENSAHLEIFNRLREREAYTDARRNVQNGRPYMWNRTVNLLSSSSDEDDDSPRLDPNAATPPYLLPSSFSRKRKAESSVFGSKRRYDPSFFGAATNTDEIVVDGPSSSIIVDDETEFQDDHIGESSQNPVVLASPASRSPDSVIIDPDNDMNSIDSGSRPFASSRSNEASSTPPAYLRSPYSPSIRTTDWWGSPEPTQRQRHDSSEFSATSDNNSNDRVFFRVAGPETRRKFTPVRVNGFYERSLSSSPETVRSVSRSPSPINPEDVQIIAELKPKHMRTPELVDVDDDLENVKDRKPSTAELTIALDDGPSTSGTSGSQQRSVSSEPRRRHRSHKKHRHHHHRHDGGHKKKKSSKKEKKSKRHRRDKEREHRRRSRSPGTDGGSHRRRSKSRSHARSADNEPKSSRRRYSKSPSSDGERKSPRGYVSD